MGCCSCAFGCIKGGINVVAKTVLMSLNGFFAVQGLILTVVATIALIMADALGLGHDFWIWTIVFGGTILVTCVLGCCGACFKNKILLIVYMVLLVLLIIGQIVVVSNAANVKVDTKNGMEEKFNAYNPDLTNTSKPVDDYQINYKCCGINSYNDWRNNTYLSEDHSLPESCCNEDNPECGYGFFNTFNTTGTPDLTKINSNGCWEDIDFWGKLVWGMMISVIIIQAVLVVLAGCLSWKCGGDD